MFPTINIRLKHHKKSPLSFQHHKAILKPHHNSTPKSSSTTTTAKPLPLDSDTTLMQLTSTNIPTIVGTTITNSTANTPTTTHTVSTIHIHTNTMTNNTTTTNTSTQTNTPLPVLMQLNIPIPPRFHAPSTFITIPLLSIPPSLIFPCTLQDFQLLGLCAAPLPSTREQ